LFITAKDHYLLLIASHAASGFILQNAPEMTMLPLAIAGDL
jgi:hypothetical protein